MAYGMNPYQISHASAMEFRFDAIQKSAISGIGLAFHGVDDMAVFALDSHEAIDVDGLLPLCQVLIQKSDRLTDDVARSAAS